MYEIQQESRGESTVLQCSLPRICIVYIDLYLCVNMIDLYLSEPHYACTQFQGGTTLRYTNLLCFRKSLYIMTYDPCQSRTYPLIKSMDSATVNRKIMPPDFLNCHFKSSIYVHTPCKVSSILKVMCSLMIQWHQVRDVYIN